MEHHGKGVWAWISTAQRPYKFQFLQCFQFWPHARLPLHVWLYPTDIQYAEWTFCGCLCLHRALVISVYIWNISISRKEPLHLWAMVGHTALLNSMVIFCIWFAWMCLFHIFLIKKKTKTNHTTRSPFCCLLEPSWMLSRLIQLWLLIRTWVVCC